MIAIFIRSYLNVTDSYEVNAAPSLEFMSFTRYLMSGGVSITGNFIYEKSTC